MSNPLSFRNMLCEAVTLYDSFGKDAQNPSFYGKLTFRGSVQPGQTLTLEPLHALNVIIAFGADGHPVGRYVSLTTYGFDITAEDKAAVRTAEAFIDQLAQQPLGSKLAQDFYTKAKSPAEVNAFFKSTPAYAKLDFPIYMLALTYKASHPVTITHRMPKSGAPMPAPPGGAGNQVYLLSTLCGCLGGQWPLGLPDVGVRDFRCEGGDGNYKLGGAVDLVDFTYETDDITRWVGVLAANQTVEVLLEFSAESLGATRLSFLPDDIHFKLPGNRSLWIQRPTVSISLNPAFQFFVFQVSGVVACSINGQKFGCLITLTVDNIEISAGVVIPNDNNWFPMPPELKGVHLKELDFSLGLIFEPPSVAVGIGGKCLIGKNTTIATDDFVIVLAIAEDYAEVLYIAFDAPSMDLPTFIEVFTDERMEVDFLVSFQQLSLTWVANLLAPVTLPNGSLTQPGFGCSALVVILDFEFYGLIKLGLSGIQTVLSSSPVRFGSIFRLEGGGQGVAFQVNASGEPLKNAKFLLNADDRQQNSNAPVKQFVEPGGPELTINSRSEPYFMLSADASFLDIAKQSISATAEKCGFSFELQSDERVIQGRISCQLLSYHNFIGKFGARITVSSAIGPLDDTGLGALVVTADARFTLAVTTSLDSQQATCSVELDVAGQSLSVGPFGVGLDTGALADLIGQAETRVDEEAGNLLRPLLGDARQWVRLVEAGVIQGVPRIGGRLKTAFGTRLDETLDVMHDAGLSPDQAVREAKEAFDPASGDLARGLKQAFNQNDSEFTGSLAQAGVGPADVAKALSDNFGLDPQQISDCMQSTFRSDQIKGAFEQLGGRFASAFNDTLDKGASTAKDIAGSIVKGLRF